MGSLMLAFCSGWILGLVTVSLSVLLGRTEEGGTDDG